MVLSPFLSFTENADLSKKNEICDEFSELLLKCNTLIRLSLLAKCFAAFGSVLYVLRSNHRIGPGPKLANWLKGLT